MAGVAVIDAGACGAEELKTTGVSAQAPFKKFIKNKTAAKPKDKFFILVPFDSC
jgi:hypothetical protein